MVRKTPVMVGAAVALMIAGGAVALTTTAGRGSPSAASPSAASAITSSPSKSLSTLTAPSSTLPPTAAPSTAAPTTPTRTPAVVTSSAASATANPSPPAGGVPGGIGPGLDPPVTPPPPGSPVPVTISYAGWDPAGKQVQVNAFIGVIESGGKCTLTVANGTDRRTATGAASPDASTTVCDQLTISSSTMAAGTWTATVSYTSSAHQGQSAPSSVVVR